MEEAKIFVLGSVSTYETEAFTTSLQSANKPKPSEASKNLVVIPPDGGWGWIVVLAAFISFFMAEGVICGFGIFLSEMSKSFNCKMSQVSLIGAIMTGCFCFSGKLSFSFLVQLLRSVIPNRAIFCRSYKPLRLQKNWNYWKHHWYYFLCFNIIHLIPVSKLLYLRIPGWFRIRNDVRFNNHCGWLLL